MRKKIICLVSISLASVIALSGCSSNDKLPDGNWEFDIPDDLEDELGSGSLILNVNDQNFTLRSVDSYGDVNVDDTVTGRVNRPKRALEIYNANGTELMTEAEKDNAGSGNVIEYKLKDNTLIIRAFGEEEWKGKKK